MLLYGSVALLLQNEARQESRHFEAAPNPLDLATNLKYIALFIPLNKGRKKRGRRCTHFEKVYSIKRRPTLDNAIFSERYKASQNFSQSLLHYIQSLLRYIHPQLLETYYQDN